MIATLLRSFGYVTGIFHLAHKSLAVVTVMNCYIILYHLRHQNVKKNRKKLHARRLEKVEIEPAVP